MKQLILGLLVAALSTTPVLAGQIQYTIRADGLACPYCAYGIQKTFEKIKGVNSVKVDLDTGIVLVTADDRVHFTDAQLSQLFKASGFTYRGIKQKSAVNPPQPSSP